MSKYGKYDMVYNILIDNISTIQNASMFKFLPYDVYKQTLTMNNFDFLITKIIINT